MVFYQKIILYLLILIGTIFQVIPVIRSGLQYEYGYGFWGPNGHDGVWHLSLINHLNNPLKIDLPIFSGTTLSNYHPFFDIVINLASRLTTIPSSIWLFQIFPIISALLLLYLSFKLGLAVTKSYWGGLILLILNFSANSLGWLIDFIKNGSFGGESIFWAMQSPSNQINPPYNLSLIFISIILLILIKNTPQQSLTFRHSLIIFVLLTLLPITKAYSAIIGFGFMAIYSLVSLIKYRIRTNFYLFVLSLISAILIFLIYNQGAGSLLVFKPFWFINTMIDSPDKFYFAKLSSLRYTLESLNYFDLRLILVYGFSFTIFIIGNFAWRLFGFTAVFQKPDYLKFTILLLIIVQIVIPTFFIQKGTSWNTIQFLYYAMFLANILLTIFLVSLKGVIQLVLITIIFLSNLIGLVGMLPNYLGKIPPAALPTNEIQALNFLSTQPYGTVLTFPYDEFAKRNFKTTPVPLYAYETTSYVSAYSRLPTFVDDYMNLANSGYDYLPRLKSSTDFFNQKNIFQDRGFLVNNDISYIYLTSTQLAKTNLNLADLSLIQIYKNDDVTVYKVLK